jgi:hypothetical protein
MERFLLRLIDNNKIKIIKLKMRRTIFLWLAIVGMSLISSCSSFNEKTGVENRRASDKILQQADGTISLKLEKADCYSDMADPSDNTAEWNVVVSKSGRYNVWLSSATKDTTNLHFNDKVLVSVHDARLIARPLCDKIIRHSSDVSYPYFKADSFLGSMYIQDTGVYNIQLISEKILPKDYKGGESSGADITKLLSVSFTPEKR